MKPTIQWSLALAVFSLLAENSVYAIPQGFGELPAGIVIPKDDRTNETLPVELLPGSPEDGNTIFVKPLQGELVSTDLKHSPLAQCDQVTTEINATKVNTRVRKQLSDALDEATRRYSEKKEERDRLAGDLAFIKERLTQLATSIPEISGRADAMALSIKEIGKKIVTLQGEIEDESNAETVTEKKAQIAQLQAERKKLRKEASALDDELSALRREESQSKAKLATFTGSKAALDAVLTDVAATINSVASSLATLEENLDKQLAKYSQAEGGRATFVFDFAPARYIAKLEEANANYHFRYVSTATATVRPTIAGNLKEDSPLNARLGNTIIAADWSDAASARATHPATIALLNDSQAISDPVGEGRKRFMELENSLTGGKYLALKLSVMGYCMLRNPEKFSSEFQSARAAANGFKLALYYTYPVKYGIKVHGHYKLYEILKELHTLTTSSSWFGLSKKRREEHIKDLFSDDKMQVSVQPLGALQLSIEDTRALTEKVKEQLSFYAAQHYLDMSKGQYQTDNLQAQATGGAIKTLGAKIALIPNPWTRWGGMVLGALGDMFGKGSNSVRIQETISKEVTIDEENGFVFTEPAESVIGNIQSWPDAEVNNF